MTVLLDKAKGQNIDVPENEEEQLALLQSGQFAVESTRPVAVVEKNGNIRFIDAAKAPEFVFGGYGRLASKREAALETATRKQHGVLPTVAAALEGAVEGVLGPGAPVAFQELIGGDLEGSTQRKLAHPVAGVAGQLGGIVGTSMPGVAAKAATKLAPLVGRKAANLAAAPLGVSPMLGNKAALFVAKHVGNKPYAKPLTEAARAIAETVPYMPAMAASRTVYNQDPEDVAIDLAAHMGVDAILSGGVGTLFGGAGIGGALIRSRIKDAKRPKGVNPLQDKLDEVLAAALDASDEELGKIAQLHGEMEPGLSPEMLKESVDRLRKSRVSKGWSGLSGMLNPGNEKVQALVGHQNAREFRDQAFDWQKNKGTILQDLGKQTTKTSDIGLSAGYEVRGDNLDTITDDIIDREKASFDYKTLDKNANDIFSAIVAQRTSIQNMMADPFTTSGSGPKLKTALEHLDSLQKDLFGAKGVFKGSASGEIVDFDQKAAHKLLRKARSAINDEMGAVTFANSQGGAAETAAEAMLAQKNIYNNALSNEGLFGSLVQVTKELDESAAKNIAANDALSSAFESKLAKKLYGVRGEHVIIDPSKLAAALKDGINPIKREVLGQWIINHKEQIDLAIKYSGKKGPAMEALHDARQSFNALEKRLNEVGFQADLGQRLESLSATPAFAGTTGVLASSLIGGGGYLLGASNEQIGPVASVGSLAAGLAVLSAGMPSRVLGGLHLIDKARKKTETSRTGLIKNFLGLDKAPIARVAAVKALHSNFEGRKDQHPTSADAYAARKTEARAMLNDPAEFATRVSAKAHVLAYDEPEVIDALIRKQLQAAAMILQDTAEDPFAMSTASLFGKAPVSEPSAEDQQKASIIKSVAADPLYALKAMADGVLTTYMVEKHAELHPREYDLVSRKIVEEASEPSVQLEYGKRLMLTTWLQMEDEYAPVWKANKGLEMIQPPEPSVRPGAPTYNPDAAAQKALSRNYETGTTTVSRQMDK
jgi:hypothetical protein